VRVVAGELKGRKLSTPSSSITRPIMDRVKVSLFDILANYTSVEDNSALDSQGKIYSAEVLDLFAGSGSWGIEALSRGAKKVTFIDESNEAIKHLKKNLSDLNIQSKSLVKKTNSFHFLKNTAYSYDLIFSDPPQENNLWFESLRVIAENPSCLNKYGLIVVKLGVQDFSSVNFTNLKLVREKKIGNSLLLFFEKN
jgi:16S rRNA (guanine966-N2)-methyltransferase